MTVNKHLKRFEKEYKREVVRLVEEPGKGNPRPKKVITSKKS